MPTPRFTLAPPEQTPAARSGVQWPAGPRTYGQAGIDIYNTKRGVFGAQGAQYDAEDAQLAAQRKALTASRFSTAASQAYLGERERAHGASMQDYNLLWGAKNDTQNLIDTANIKRGFAAGDWRFGASGAQTPTDVVLPEGQVSNNIGVRAAPVSNADRIETANTDRATRRRFTLEGSQLNVDRAQGQEALAKLDASEAGLNTAAAGNGVQRARLSADMAEFSPAADLVYDSESGTFVTRDEQRLNNSFNSWKFDPELQKYGLSPYMTQRQLNERTDQDGNLRLDDGRKLDPKTKNIWTPREGNVGGLWTDPDTGNEFQKYTDPQGNVHDSWRDTKTGNVYVIMNPKTGAGYWLSPQGYFLSADGIWRNPVTGQAIYSATGQPFGRGTQSAGSSVTVPWGADAPSTPAAPAGPPPYSNNHPNN